MYAVYAGREVDDIADGRDPEPKKLEDLNKWRREIAQAYGVNQRVLLDLPCNWLFHNTSCRKRTFATAMTRELNRRASAFSDYQSIGLGVYCERVARAVGRLSNAICRYYPRRRRCSGKIPGGSSSTPSNILRDVAEDAKRDHVYLPDDLLVKTVMSAQLRDFAIDDPAIARTCSSYRRSHTSNSAPQTVIQKLDLKT